jgi:hypothetical protein
MNRKTAMKKAVTKKAAPAKKKTATPKAEEPTFQILQTAKCETVSGKSQLTYNIAQDENGQVMIRIAANTGGGFWSKEFVAVAAIVNLLESLPNDQPVTSVHLFQLFVGKSQNTPGFLLAALLNEGLLKPSGKKRQYAMSESGVDKFLAKVEKLKS